MFIDVSQLLLLFGKFDKFLFQMCQEVWPDETVLNLYFLLVNLGLQYLVPLSIILVFYVLLMLKIWKRKIPVFHSVCQRETSTDTVDQWNARIVEQSKIKVLKMLIIIVSLFALSWLPLYLIFLYLKFGHYNENSSFGMCVAQCYFFLFPMTHKYIIVVLYNIHIIDKLVISITPLAQWLGASNSCVNPILYFFFNAKFRAYLKKAITRSLLCSSSREFIRNHVYHNNNNHNNNLQPTQLQVTNGHNHTFNQVNFVNQRSQNTLLHCASDNNIAQMNNHNHIEQVIVNDDILPNGKIVNLNKVVDKLYCCQTSLPFDNSDKSYLKSNEYQNGNNEENHLLTEHEKFMFKQNEVNNIQPRVVPMITTNGNVNHHFDTLNSVQCSNQCQTLQGKNLIQYVQPNSLLRPKQNRETSV